MKALCAPKQLTKRLCALQTAPDVVLRTADVDQASCLPGSRVLAEANRAFVGAVGAVFAMTLLCSIQRPPATPRFRTVTAGRTLQCVQMHGGPMQASYVVPPSRERPPERQASMDPLYDPVAAAEHKLSWVSSVRTQIPPTPSCHIDRYRPLPSTTCLGHRRNLSATSAGRVDSVACARSVTCS